MMHMAMNGHAFLPDADFTIATVFPTVGYRMGYMYDLGDHWVHEIVVEEIVPEEDSKNIVEVLGGSGACPPE